MMVFRKPNSLSNSIEFLFYNISASLKNRRDITEYQLPCLSKGFFPRLCNVIMIARSRKCIVHITGDTYYAILGAIFCKRLITVHDLSFLTRTKGLTRKVLKLFWITLPVRFSHRVIAVSETTKQALLKEVYVHPDKIKVIYNFIDPVYKPVKRTFNRECPVILQIGTNFNKNISNLIRALKGISCHLVLIGYLTEEEIQLLDSMKVQYTNKFSLSKEELHLEYLRADILSFVSVIEGFGMPILEAQATGLPVITSICSSMPEVAGEGALQVNPYDVASIRKGIKQLINCDSLREQFVEAGFNNVSRFSKERVVEDYYQIYNELENRIG